ncbi:MAG: DNA mismatch repair endonuclease MutL, partial [Planctomycetes bacterium]|nr:DNA mismatch repair endonuclease MutL [Planctomycetota bacterium]
MAKIHILPVTVQNKIAAGEVIERPASVVKELAENSVDAGATHVAVELEDGGHRLIRVSDDGHGMDEDDLIASMQRHATSKIRDVDDIFRIRTFGFRGEALPSIGSVSRMAIATCLPGAAPGHELLVEGGRAVRVSTAAPRKG